MDQSRTEEHVIREAMQRTDRVGSEARSLAGTVAQGGHAAAIGLMQFSNALADAGELHDATILAMAGRERLEAAGDTAGVATATMELGLIQLDRGHVDEALELLADAKRRLEANDPRNDLPAATLNLGNALRRAGRPRDALLQYDAAGSRFARAGDSMGVANACFNIGNVCTELGRYGTALERYREAKDMYGLLGREDKVADCQLAAGEIMYPSGDPNVLLSMLAALDTYERLALPIQLARGRLRVAHMLDHDGGHDEAASLARQALDGFEAMGMWADALDARAVLVHAHLGRGDTEAAAEALAAGET